MPARILAPFSLASLFALSLACCRSGTDIHVSPHGDDSAAGTRRQPLATLEKALEKARTAPRKPATIWLADGDYRFARPLTLQAADSGRPGQALVIRSLKDRKARLLGGTPLRPRDFQEVTDPATLRRIAAPAQGKIVEIHLESLGVVHSKAYPDVFKDAGGIADLYCNGERMTLARFPNDGWMTFESVLHNAGGPLDGDWNNPESFQKVPPGSPGGTFRYRKEFQEKHALWKQQLHRGVWFRGYWRVAWENSAKRVLAIDDNQRTATFAKPINLGIGNKYNRPKGNGREAYRAINLLEEIDRPGEWCMDFTDRKIYFYPPAPLESAEIILVDRNEPVVHLRDASHILLRDLTLQYNLGDGIRVTGGRHVEIAGCTIRNVNRNAIVIDGGSDHVARSNDLFKLGAGGIWLGGGDAEANPRIPARHRAVNNHIHHFGQIEPVYAAAINAGFSGGGGGGHHTAVGMYVAHNLIHDTPHVGVLFGSMDSVFEYNEIYRYCLVSNDMGAFYSYDYRKRNFGNHTFRHNFIHSSPLGDGIYFDHDHPDLKVIGNVVALGSTGTRGTAFLFKQGDMPKDGFTQAFDCVGNIAVDCKFGFEFVSILPHQGNIAHNAAFGCRTPFRWSEIKQGRLVPTQPYPTGPNASFADAPALRDIRKRPTTITRDARLLAELPEFPPIPMDQIGLHTDEFRKRLPSERERNLHAPDPGSDPGLGYDILDRR